MPNEAPRARALGVNHLVLEVGDLDAALDFYGQIFQFTLRGRSETAVFIDLGDQFLQFSLGKTQDADGRRHFGLVVDDRAAVRARLDAMGVEIFERLNFRDPWGNRVEVVPLTISISPKPRRCSPPWAPAKSPKRRRRWRNCAPRACGARMTRLKRG